MRYLTTRWKWKLSITVNTSVLKLIETRIVKLGIVTTVTSLFLSLHQFRFFTFQSFQLGVQSVDVRLTQTDLSLVSWVRTGLQALQVELGYFNLLSHRTDPLCDTWQIGTSDAVPVVPVDLVL